MTFVLFTQWFTVVPAALLVVSYVLWLLRNTKAFPADVDWLGGALTVITAVISLILWLVVAGTHNGRAKDINECESLAQRGHETLMVEYNYFNRDCFIKVDGQWLRVRDSAWGRNI